MASRSRLVRDQPFISRSELTGRWYFVQSWYPSGPNGQHRRAHVKHDITDEIERIIEEAKNGK